MLSTFAEGRIFGETYGAAPARVVALHGWARTHADFTSVLAGFDAIALDLPGFGATPEPTGEWGSPEYAAGVADVLRALPRPPVVVGHSLGGRIGVHLAASYPELVSGLVLTGAPLIRVTPPARPKTSYRVARWLNRRGVLSEDRMQAAREKHYAPDWRNATPGMRPVFVRLVSETYDAQITSIRCPTRLVWGDGDTAAPVAGAQELARRLGAPLRVVPGAGHLTPLTAVDELRAAIEEMVA
ncbi:MAG TPA: alpha/beta hydrolase [Acidimicrobiales bacterium]|nr:alpha/beta hydrolase [Acidimicrobiales bacterium]